MPPRPGMLSPPKTCPEAKSKNTLAWAEYVINYCYFCAAEELSMRIFGFLLALAAVAYAGNPSNTIDNSLSAAGRLAKKQADSVNSGSGQQPGGGCVNEPDCGEVALSASSLQSETSIAIDSTGQHVVIAFNDFRGFGTTVSISGFAYS